MAQGFVAEAQPIERQLLLKLIRKWGDVNTDGLLEESCQQFLIPDVEGFIGYKVESSNAIVFGDPVCSPEEKATLAMAFQNYCESQNLGVVYTIVSQEFSDWAIEHLSAVSIEFGEKFILDPLNNPINGTGPKAALVRKKIKHALKEGISIQEYTDQNSNIEQGIEEVAEAWLDKRHGPQIYLSQMNLFKDRMGKRYFYALQDNKIIGFLILNAIQAKGGWLLNNLKTVKNAPNGISELLVISTLQILAEENCRYVLAGPVPGIRLGKIIGISKTAETLTRWLFKLLKIIFNLEGLTTFWSKFQPQAKGAYVIFPKKNLGFMSVRALLRAFNVGK